MTRINCSIKPEELCDKHLLAEIRELPRILNKAKQNKYKSKPLDNFTLNKGHELSLVNKLKYLVLRHKSLILEANLREFNIMDYTSSYEDLPKLLYNDWTPPPYVRVLLKERINERLKAMINIKMYKKLVDFKNIIIK